MQQSGTQALRLCIPISPIAQGPFRACRTHTVIFSHAARSKSSSGLSDLAVLIDRNMRDMPQRNIQFVARMAPLPFPDERAFLGEIREVTGGCCWRCARDRAVLAGAHTALKSFRSLFEHPQQCFFLPLVKLPTDAVEQLCLVDKEFDEREGASLSFDRCTREPSEPLSNFVAFIRGLERCIIARAPGE